MGYAADAVGRRSLHANLYVLADFASPKYEALGACKVDG